MRRNGIRRTVAVVCAPLLIVTVLTLPQPAAAADPFRPTAPQRIPPVPTRDVAPLSARTAPQAAKARRAPVWPAAAIVEMTVPASSDRSARGVNAPGLAVSVGAGSDSPQRTRVTVFDHSTAKAAGVDGVLARVESADGTGLRGTVGISIAYASFASAHGADWSSRLQLATMPECALTTPGRAGCTPTPLLSRNDMAAQTVSAVAPVGTLVATVAGSSSGSGDYAATPLKASAAWSAGGNSGDFAWSYPMRVPPVLSGPVPTLALSYSSQSVDGLGPANNNQPSWVGAGFDLAAGGMIERRYKLCNDDKSGGNNASLDNADLCWASDNAVLALGGHAGELLYNAAEKRWHLRNDDGTRIEKRTGAVNGDNDGEWWVVTTADGTQYWFGRNRLPGSPGTASTETGSTLTVPIYGNQPSEPCHNSTFAASSCAQAWRWNLDYVIDMNGNTMSMWYGTASNRYASNMDTAHPVSYIRDGWLKKIEYGTRSSQDLAADPAQTTASDSIFATAAPMEVEFVPDDRCLSSCATHDAAHWPDVPWDRECLGSTCNVVSPTFWSTRRLKQVITKVREGASYRNVETWTLTHSFPDPGDGTSPPLRLDALGHAGGSDSVPDVTFGYAQLNNRVDPSAPDNLPAMNWFRINQITTETGATVSVSYSGVDCVKGVKMPDVNALENNTYRCYPVKWKKSSGTAVTEFFHKYVVTMVRENDRTGGSPPFGSPEVEHTYTYPTDAAAWHYTDEDGLVKDQDKTWSNWRGYPWVGVTTGKAGTTDAQQYVQTSYYRGMHGDHLPSGTRTAILPAVDMNGDGDTSDAGIDAAAVNDETAFAGMARRTITYNGPSGSEVSSQVTQAWMSAPTASRTIAGITVTARFRGVEETHARVALDHAPSWRTTSTHTTFDGYGLPTTMDDFGDDSTSTDDQCERTTYARNVDAWIVSAHSEQTSFALSCARAANPATLTEADVITNVRQSFDLLAWGTAPVKGMVTAVARAVSWNAGSPTDQATESAVYDAQGRVIEQYDALNRKTTTAYTPTTGGPVTQVVTTKPSPFNFTTTTVMDSAYGQATAVIDTNNRRTDMTYDGLGRRTAVWLAGRDKATQSASITYSYSVRNDRPVATTTRRLNPSGGYTVTYSLADGLLRDRQTQSASPSGGRIVTDTFYDSAGRRLRTYGAYYDSRGGPGQTLVVPTDRHNVPAQTYVLYDGAGRVTDEVFDPYNNGERWRTHTFYTGDRTEVTPPTGASRTATYTDARDNRTALWQYGYPTANDHMTTAYTYDRRNRPLRITDQSGNYWEYGYDLLGRQTSVRDPDAGTVLSTYDKAGRLTTTQGPLGQLAYEYDNVDRRIGLYLGSVAPANRLSTWSFDQARFDGTATPVLGYPSSSTRWTSNGTVGYTTTVLGYDNSYEATGRSITIPPSETGIAGTYTYQTTYREDGSLESMVYPAAGDLGDEATTIGYDPATGLPDSLASIDDTGESSYVSATVFDALARVSQYTFYTGMFSGIGSHAWLAYQRELDTGRITNIKTSRESVTPNVVADLQYTFNNAGNITRIADAAVNDNQCFNYDGLGRLVEAWTPASTCGTPSTATLGGPAKYWTTWTVNAIGNRTKQVEHATASGGADATTTYSYPSAGASRPHTVTATAGARAGTYTYDAGGNTTCRPTAASNVCPPSTAVNSQVLSWDVEGHVASIQAASGTTTYLYDADGNRLIERDPTGRTLYLPGQEVRYIASTGRTTCTRYYEFNGQTVASRTSASLSWLSGDHQGTSTIAINAATQVSTVRRQTPFGAARGSSVSWVNGKGFVGGLVDAAGLTHLGAREYDSALGRFLSADPEFNRDDPQSMNNYAYSDNSPATLSDPTGRRVPCGQESDEEVECARGANKGAAAAAEAAHAMREAAIVTRPSFRKMLNSLRNKGFMRAAGKLAREHLVKNIDRALILAGFVLNAVAYFEEGDGPVTSTGKAAVVSAFGLAGEVTFAFIAAPFAVMAGLYCGPALPFCAGVLEGAAGVAGAWAGSALGEQLVDGLLDRAGVWKQTELVDAVVEKTADILLSGDYDSGDKGLPDPSVQVRKDLMPTAKDYQLVAQVATYLQKSTDWRRISIMGWLLG
jgi:RHS repeat-associated protein